MPNSFIALGRMTIAIGIENRPMIRMIVSVGMRTVAMAASTMMGVGSMMALMMMATMSVVACYGGRRLF